MAVTKKQYAQMTNTQSPNSPIVRNCIWAFLSGGAICTIGQIMTNIYQHFGLKELDASNATTITLIFLGAFLTGLHVYDKLAKYAGAGTLVPITGFANAVVSPALEFKSEGFVLGLGAKMFTIVGPVLVYGITASILYGFVLWIFKLF
ncbi:MAG: stage V sporulation protein AC [Ethanoligenens sp.]